MIMKMLLEPEIVIVGSIDRLFDGLIVWSVNWFAFLYSIVRWDFPSEEHVYSTVLKPLAAALSIPEDLQDYKNVPMNSVNLCAWSPQGDDEESPRENIPSRSGSSTSKPSRHDRSSRQDRHRKPEKSQAILKKRKIDFQSEVCTYVLQVLNSYRSPQCTQVRVDSILSFWFLYRF